jgi:hypothetical protein
VFAGVGGVGSGMALSGEVPEGDMRCISDILWTLQFVICAQTERIWEII